MKNTLFILLIAVSLSAGCADLRTVTRSEPVRIDSGRLVSFPPDEWKTYTGRSGMDHRHGKSQIPVTVLGHYPEYVLLAEKLEARSLQIPMNEWNTLTPRKQWRITARFLNRMSASGHLFRLATPLEQAKPGSFYVREVNHLLKKGYRPSPDGQWLAK